MEVHQISQLGPGALVWVWVVRVGKGRWWPGSVLSISALKPFPIVDARFECRAAGKNGIDGAAFIGITSTRMRYLEPRNPDLKGGDRPNFVPRAIFAKPEQRAAGADDAQHPETATGEDRAAKAVSPPAAKKPRVRKKAKASIPIQDAAVVAD
jgi:hypothetical protein